ncbi:MAG: His/Gly/Thr/Pro-type tRNA ligase C-terminal domain-containing protein, partial [bacterium]|nr:His/Gly/Thr/Pro-type tRNA ligase C-terminal domain-containing protein [bacterium]
RLMATIVEANHDKNGIIWPEEVAPFQVHLIPIEDSGKVIKAAGKLYQDLEKEGIEVLYDDRKDKSAGEKFAEADLIGIPVRIVVSEKTLAKNSIEIKKRNETKMKLIKLTDTKKHVQ